MLVIGLVTATATPACLSLAEALCGPHCFLGPASEQAAEAAAKPAAGESLIWLQSPLRSLLAGHEDARSPVCSGRGTSIGDVTKRTLPLTNTAHSHSILCILLPYRRPKSEKKNAKDIPSDTQSPISTKRKKKGFLPETKKRKKLKSEGVTPEKNAASQQDAVTEGAMPAATDKDQPPSTGKRKRKRVKASTPSQMNGITVAKSPAPNNPTLSPSTPAKTPKLQKKKEKLSQVNGATPVSPIEPESKKQHQKALSTKEVIKKSPQSALPKKRARLSLVSRSPSLLQSGVRKRRAVRRRVQTP